MKLYTHENKSNSGFKLALVEESSKIFFSKKGLNTSFRIIFFEQGTGIIHCNQKNIPFIGPCCFCFNEVDEIEIFSSDNINLVHYIFFHPETINNSFDFNNIRGDQKIFTHSEIQDLYWLEPFTYRKNKFCGYLCFGPLTAKHIKELFVNINNELSVQKDNFWPCRSRSYLFELLTLFMKIYSSTKESEYISIEKIDPEIDNIVNYLNSNYHHKISISKITKLFNIDRTTLAEKFKKSTGYSLISYVNKMRIQIACTFLKDTGLPVSEIMYRVGFEDKTHFGRLFKKHTNMSPGQYRLNL